MARWTSRRRLEAVIHREKPDRPPVALWRHFPVDDQKAASLADVHQRFAESFGWDLLKVSPAATYPLVPWGLEDAWQGDVWGRRTILKRPVRDSEDWAHLVPSDPRQGMPGMTLEALTDLARHLEPHVPVFQTIFSPLIQAKYLAGEEKLLVHMRRSPEALHQGLQRITEATLRYLEALRTTGVSGVFYAVQHAQYAWLSEEEYRTFGRPYDLALLGYARAHFDFVMLHLHGQDIMFHLFTDYPVHIWHWHDRETPPSLQEAQTLVPGAVAGGLRRETLLLGTPEDVFREVREAWEQTQGRGWILTTGCVLALTTPEGNIWAARKAVEVLGSEG